MVLCRMRYRLHGKSTAEGVPELVRHYQGGNNNFLHLRYAAEPAEIFHLKNGRAQTFAKCPDEAPQSVGNRP
ncbi:MAG: hypothetical protein ACI4QD_05940 [Kiritimatiellia bacterium]